MRINFHTRIRIVAIPVSTFFGVTLLTVPTNVTTGERSVYEYYLNFSTEGRVHALQGAGGCGG